MKKAIIILSVFVVGCNQSVDDYFNELTPPIVVLSTDHQDRTGVMFQDSNNKILVLYVPAFKSLQVGDTIRK